MFMGDEDLSRIGRLFPGLARIEISLAPESAGVRPDVRAQLPLEPVITRATRVV
jgi:hypothetical protein